MVEISQLNFSYHQTRSVFCNLNLKLLPGNIYGLLGKNGAGKTTLLKTICGLLFAQAGHCRVFEQDARKRLPRMLQQIFFIPETFHLPEISIKNFVHHYSVFYPQFDRDYFYSKLELFQLDQQKKLNSLSFGEKKRFLLSFGLSSNARLMIMDEPSNGLDITAQAEIKKILIEKVHEDKIIIISTHHVKEFENIFDHLIIIDQGKILLNCQLNHIKTHLRTEFVSQIESEKGVLYFESIAGGFLALKYQPGEEQQLDIAFLFNAVLKQSAQIIQVLNPDQEKPL